jgi:hypothetical protein
MDALPNANFSSQLEQTVPACAVGCITDTLRSSSCPALDAACLCPGLFQVPAVEGCIMKACRGVLVDLFATTNATASACQISPRQFGGRLDIAALATTPVAVLCIIMRLLGRPAARHKVLDPLDDAMMIINAAATIGACWSFVKRMVPPGHVPGHAPHHQMGLTDHNLWPLQSTSSATAPTCTPCRRKTSRPYSK